MKRYKELFENKESPQEDFIKWVKNRSTEGYSVIIKKIVTLDDDKDVTDTKEYWPNERINYGKWMYSFPIDGIRNTMSIKENALKSFKLIDEDTAQVRTDKYLITLIRHK